MKGRLTLIATPIGNLGDLSPRACTALTEADLWIVEDTRVSGKLAFHLGLKKPMRALNEHTRPDQVDKYAEAIRGQNVVLLTDGGSPAISDPGARLTDLAHDHGYEVDAIPGPSAPIDALVLSGFFAQRFAFLGFLGRKPGDIRAEFLPFADSPMTLVLFESPFRFRKTLAIASEVLGDRRYAICRELTKLHQQVYRSTLPVLPDEATVPAKGEFTLVIEGRRKAGAR